MSDILRISIPITIWIAAFSAIYGVEGAVCSPHWGGAGLNLRQGRLMLLGAWALAIAAQVVAIVVLRGRFASPHPWTRRLSVLMAVVALVATIWGMAPIVLTSLCQ